MNDRNINPFMFRRMLERAIANEIKPLQRRIRMVANRASIQSVNDLAKVQRVRISGLQDELMDDLQRVQQFGFSGNPPAGSTCVLISIGGSRTHPVVIACDDPLTRFKSLLSGESAQYNSAGDFVHIKGNGEIHVKASAKVTSDAPLTHALGDAEVDGDGWIHGNLLVDGDFHVVGASHFEGAVTADSSIASAGAISSATSISDPTRSMAEMISIYNDHHNKLSGGGTSLDPVEKM